jgi:hypothetical protein
MNLRHSRHLLITSAAVVLAAAVIAGCSQGGATAGSPRSAAGRQPAAAGIVQVSHDQFGAHAEPSVAVNPRNPGNLLAASQVFQGRARGLATYASFDGGVTWQSNGVLPGAAPANDADVTATFDQAGHGYVSAEMSGGVVGGEPGTAYVWRTDDGGRHFGPAVAAMRGSVDHPGLAADPAAGSTDLYLAGIVFHGSAGEVRFARSTDSGRSFEPARSIDPSRSPYDRLTVVAAGPGGTVAVMYYVEPPGGGVTVAVATSTDHGASFAAPVRLGTVRSPAPVPGVNARSGPAIAIDSRTGDIYASVTTYAPAAGASQVEVFTSRDHGRSWSAPAVVASTAAGTYFQPQLAAGDGGQVGLSVFELVGSRVHVVMVTSTPGGASFGPPRTVTGSSFDPTLGLAGGDGAAAERWIGDYQGLAATPGAFHPLWNDTRTGHLELVTATVPAAPQP